MSSAHCITNAVYGQCYMTAVRLIQGAKTCPKTWTHITPHVVSLEVPGEAPGQKLSSQALPHTK